MRAASVSLLAALLLLVAVHARGETVEAVSAIDGDTLALGDGRTLRLAGIVAPRSPPGQGRWRRAGEAAAALQSLAAGRLLRLESLGEDRHRKLVAQAWREDGTWLQGELLRRGAARVRTAPEERSRAAEMLAIEREARGRKAGLWADPFYAIRQAEEGKRLLDTFHLVEGRVAAFRRVPGAVLLFLGGESALQLRLPTRSLKLFREAGLDPAMLEGARLLVRGWVFSDRRPTIELRHPEPIERLD